MNSESGAGIIFNAGVTVKVTETTISSQAGCYFQVNGTPSSPVTIEPYVAGGVWYMRLCPSASHVFDFLELTGYDEARLTDAAGTYAFTFNKHPQDEDPVVRPPILDIDDPLGRGASRVHHKGNSGAIVEISGKWRITDGQHKLVDALKSSGTLVSYISNKVQLGQAYIVLHEYPHKRGHPVVPYTIALQEAK